MTMFRIAFLVEKKKLGDVLEAIVPYAYNMENPRPVANPISSKNTKAKTAGIITVGSQPERIMGHLLNKQGKKVGDVLTSTEVRSAMKDVKVPNDSYSSVMTRLKQTGYVEPGGERGEYKLLKGVLN